MMSEELPPITSDLDEDWAMLVRLFSTWKFFFPHWRDLIIAFLRFGNNFATGTLKLTYWRRGWTMMSDKPIATIQRLKVRSELNLRQVENFFKFVFVTLLLNERGLPTPQAESLDILFEPEA